MQQDQPVFLAIHFCVTHWPFTWANDSQQNNILLDQRYSRSIEKVDQQLGELLAALKASGLLENSLVILLSDHGTTLGLPHDRIIDEKYYQGNKERLKWLTVNKLNNESESYHLDTSYGQGTDILSLKQHQIILAFKQYGHKNIPRVINAVASLLDVAPTILDYLRLPLLMSSDGLSLKSLILNNSHIGLKRPLYLETEYSTETIEKSHIDTTQVIQQGINLYDIDPETGYVFVKPQIQQLLLETKQRAVLLGDWLLARYPASIRGSMKQSIKKIWQVQAYIQPAYFVLANIKTGEWTIGFDSDLAQKAPVDNLKKLLKKFYGTEMDVR